MPQEARKPLELCAGSSRSSSRSSTSLVRRRIRIGGEGTEGPLVDRFPTLPLGEKLRQIVSTEQRRKILRSCESSWWPVLAG
jgi:hypothetical protein